MAIQVTCNCGKMLSVKDDFAGRKVKCPGCQKLLRVPAAEEFAEDEFVDEPAELPQKSRDGGKSAARGKGSKKGKKSSGSNRGLVTGLIGGGGVLVVGLLAWMLWPAKPDVVAEAPAANAVGTPATTGANGTASTITPLTGGAPKNSANSLVPTSTESLSGDLKTLQGTWEVVALELSPDTPGAAESIAQMKLITFTIKDNILSVTTPGGAAISSIKLDSTIEPRTIDMIPLDGGGRNTGLGIYSIEGETWRMCSTKGDTARPQEMKVGPGQVLVTFRRSSAPTTASASSFDIKAWQAAEGKLKAMNVKAELVNWDKYEGVEGPTHFVHIPLPETADGTISPELWSIVSSLSHIAVRTSFVTDATLRQLAQHPGLGGIVMDKRSTITAAGVGALKACPQLRTFMFYVPISPEVCEAVTQLDQLRIFGISDSSVTGDMMGAISRQSQLESLSLNNTVVADEDFLQVQKLTKLKSLSLNKSTVSDAGLKAVTSLPHLNNLSLDETKVTGEGLKSLESLSGLKSLWLQGNRMSTL